MALSKIFDISIPADSSVHRNNLAALLEAGRALEAAAIAGACHELEGLFSLYPQIVRASLTADRTGAPRFKAWAQALDGKLCELELLADCPSLHTMNDISWRVFGVSYQNKQNLESFRAMPELPWLTMFSKTRALFDQLATLAPTHARELAAKNLMLIGPDAASFAHQMELPDLAALIEAAQIESVTRKTRNIARPTPSL